MKTRFHQKIGAHDLNTAKFSSSSACARVILEKGLLLKSGIHTLFWKDWLLRQAAGQPLFRPLLRRLVGWMFQRQHQVEGQLQGPFSSEKRSPSGVKSALVTGSSQGIGEAVTHRLLAQAYEVCGLDLKPPQNFWEPPRHGHEAALTTHLVDLCEQKAVEQVIREEERKLESHDRQPFDVIVLNAGINRTGKFWEMSPTTVSAILNTNALSVYSLLLNLYRPKNGTTLVDNETTLVMVSSLSHYLSYPGAAVYAASKTFVASLAFSLSCSGLPGPSRILCVFPGPTATQQAYDCAPDNSERAVKRRMKPAGTSGLLHGCPSPTAV